MKNITVSKITQASYNQLVSLGYRVTITQLTETSSPFIKYSYNRIVAPPRPSQIAMGMILGDYCCVTCGGINCSKCK